MRYVGKEYLLAQICHESVEKVSLMHAQAEQGRIYKVGHISTVGQMITRTTLSYSRPEK